MEEIYCNSNLSGCTNNYPDTETARQIGQEFVIITLNTPGNHGDIDGKLHNSIKGTYIKVSIMESGMNIDELC